MKNFAILRKYEDSEKFLREHPDLVCDALSTWLTLYCLDLAVEEKFDLADHVAHQAVCIQFMLELAATMKIDPRSTIHPFFSKMGLAEVAYMTGFNEELEAFRGRIRRRAEEKREELIKEYEEEERKKRIGPGGLDPAEVFETLPKELQECFESRDISKLQDLIKLLPIEEATYHMKRCVDSGLWVPSKDDTAESGAAEAAESPSEMQPTDAIENEK